MFLDDENLEFFFFGCFMLEILNDFNIVLKIVIIM